MPLPIRPKGQSGFSRTPPPAPVSERQQLALLMQMTSNSNDFRSRSPSSRSKDRNERGETPLHLAAIKGDVEQVCKLLSHQTDPNVADFAGWTPLHEACNYGWFEITCRLIQSGANVNARGLNNDTPLHDAAMNGHLRLVKYLVEKGADIYAKNSKGKTPLDVGTPLVVAIMLDPNTPFTEPSISTRQQPRSRDEKKLTETNKQKNTSEEVMDSSKSTTEDVYEFKSVKEIGSSPENKPVDPLEVEKEPETTTTATSDESTKRSFSEVADGEDTGNDEDSKKKKRKEDVAKEPKPSTPQRTSGQNKAQLNKQTNNAQNKSGNASAKAAERKSPPSSPKAAGSDAEQEDGKLDLKVPPLKIVIPQSSSEQESGSTRNGKSSSQRSHQALPYVVASSNNESADKEAISGNTSPTETPNVKADDKKEAPAASEDQRSGHHQRVLRSSHRSGPVPGSADRSSNNSSPQLQRSHSPSPSASPSTPSNQPDTSTSTIHTSTATTSKTSDTQVTTSSDTEATTSTSNTNVSTSMAVVELHPRKRKMKPNKEPPVPPPTHEAVEMPAVSEIHPHEQPITNCYQLFLNIRKQIEKRRKGLFPVQPKPPQGFKDYLMNRCTYVLASTAPTTPNITIPVSLPAQMKDLYSEQEKERYGLRMQHVVEKEKLVLSVEQEILRVHGRAARALANQSLPFSVCTILRDEEVYNLITPEQEEKDRNARSRYNGRLFLSWLQDVDDKWEKIKEHMLLRHHNEAESLHAVQKMDWEWKLKELSLCDAKTTPSIDELHVPMVHVSDDFDLLPA
ncbi:hypothetical protein FQA39_LY06357 [Lamprigera yunnana]|nr:hypothetical protein FQA39_LY06357 [Lamprigera yunnana]